MTMPVPSSKRDFQKPSTIVSIVIFVLTIGFMGWLRLYYFQESFITLTYGLPLLVCLWHRDRRLLWSMAFAFALMATYKSFFLLPKYTQDTVETLQWFFQLTNIVIVAGAVHAILNLTESLHARNIELQRLNEELVAREEEITRQNEELQTQSEELQQQNEEIQQQSEEVQQQAEELQAQAEELQVANNELAQRQSMLQVLLDSLRVKGDDNTLLTKVCHSVLPLMGGKATTAAFVVKTGDDLVVRAHAGVENLAQTAWPFRSSFASIVMDHDKTAFVDDLEARKDLSVPLPRAFRSVLATPLRMNGKPIGAVEVYAAQPQSWSTEEFRILEWVAAQASLILETRQLHSELAATNAGLESTVAKRTAELQDLVNELEHFSYSITHDMRAPLRAMQGFAGMLADSSLPLTAEERSDYLQRIKTAAARMDRLITDALSYSRAVQQELTLTPVNPAVLLKGMIDSYPQFQPPHARIEVQENIPEVLANEAGLTQCFSNLLGNAIKFMPPGRVPHVKITAEQHDSSVRLYFNDNGIGISPEMLPRVFDMFQRASKDYEGTGIGLALVRKVTERMCGKVGVTSENGDGSRFWVELRRAEASK